MNENVFSAHVKDINSFFSSFSYFGSTCVWLIVGVYVCMYVFWDWELVIGEEINWRICSMSTVSGYFASKWVPILDSLLIRSLLDEYGMEVNRIILWVNYSLHPALSLKFHFASFTYIVSLNLHHLFLVVSGNPLYVW